MNSLGRTTIVVTLIATLGGWIGVERESFLRSIELDATGGAITHLKCDLTGLPDCERCTVYQGAPGWSEGCSYDYPDCECRPMNFGDCDEDSHTQSCGFLLIYDGGVYDCDGPWTLGPACTHTVSYCTGSVGTCKAVYGP